MNNNKQNKTENPLHARDHLANERTFLAWIRTSIAIMAFGFVVVKFSLFLRQLGILVGKELNYKGISPIIGVVLVVAGAAVLLLVFFRYRRIYKQLVSNSFSPNRSLIPALTITIISIALILIIYLIENIITTQR
ncbi:MAG: YidH family protein [Bacteroidia bacterium]